MITRLVTSISITPGQVSDELGYLYFRDRKGDTFR